MKNIITALKGSKKTEWAINIALIVVALLFFVALGKTLLSKNKSASNIPPLAAGTKLDWADVDWARPGQTLVLALSTDCRFCSESAPFYQRLIKGLSETGGTRVIAALPQTIKEGQAYVKSLGVAVDEVRQLELASLGLQGTPTILLVNNAGVVTDVLTGKLAAKQEQALFEQLHLKVAPDPSSEDRSAIFIHAAELKQNMRRKDFVVLDVESRDVFNLNHIPGAINIPDDELEVRALNELKTTDTIVVYCHYCEADLMSEAARSVLARNGFNHVLILSEGLKSWELEASRQKAPAN
jgi:rhodanese-related sulfurtransferase